MQDASEQDVIREETTEKAEIENEIANAAEESDSSESSEKLPTKELQEEREEIGVKEQRNVPNHEESEKEDTSNLEIWFTPDKSIKGFDAVRKDREGRNDGGVMILIHNRLKYSLVPDVYDCEELATITRSASSTPDDGMPVVPISGVAANEMKRQMETDEFKAGILTTGDKDGRRNSSHAGVAVGEWNSLPVLVERLREALELSLAAGCRHGDQPTATSSLAELGVGTEINDRLHVHRSMEQAVLRSYDYDDFKSRKDELKFLEDLLLLDIQTALSRLRETLERTDVATLAKHGGVSDSTSKLHLLRLVSSLLSRLQVPQKEVTTTGENRLMNVATAQDALVARKRRPVRHTIGVSAEEIAYARKQLEESSADLMKLNNVSIQRQRESLIVSGNVPNSVSSSASSDTPNSEKHTEEICDKCTKNAINQRQSLRDKNKDCRGDIGTYCPVTIESDESNISQDRHWYSNIDDEEAGIERTNEEQSQVTKLAAILRQRAELVSASRCNVNNNKFIAKKFKIKRANTVDIPSYLKLQAGSLDYNNSGCIQLRRPIHVGNKVTSNATNNVTVPSFHPRTENDKKFLALINRNNEIQTTFNVAPAFKSFGYTKATDMSSNENWNNRFSNIKTAFDKQSSVNDENKLSSKPRPAKHFPSALQTFSQVTNKKTPINTGNSSNSLPFTNTNVSKSDMGFRHAPSSLFRKIEKPQSPILPSNSHWLKNNTPSSGNSLREKARIMFDRDDNVQSQSTNKLKIDANENFQKPSFPRLPWIERDRNEGKTTGMIAENGRLDYRLFCKQFAPFIGKNTAAEPKILRNHEEHCKRNEHLMQREIILSPDNKLAIADEKISFKTFSEKGLRIPHHHRSSESRHGIEGSRRDKSNLLSEKDVFEQIRNRRCNEQNLSENAVVDATLSGSSSIAIQTGESSDNQPEEVRVFRVIPRVSKSQLSTYNDASVQTNQPEQPLMKYIESQKESTKERETPRYECDDVNPIVNSSFHSAEDPRSFVLNYNWNYHTLVADVVPKNESSMDENTRDLIKEQSSVYLPNPIENIPYRDVSDYHSTEQRERAFQIDNSQHENRFPSKLGPDNKLQIYQNYPPDMKSNKDSLKSDENDFSCTNNGGLPEEQNIQNQDISADAGVVTRYTCAIATVASADILEMPSEETGPEFIISSSPSPSHSRPYAGETSNEIITTKEEIRRHNMLQQSLVNRLQNERMILNDQYAPVYKQPSSLNQSTKFQSFNTPKLEPPLIGFLSIPPSSGLSTSGTTINRVTTLRGQYEQPGGQPRPVQKERSPILRGLNSAMDSSDKYLISCSNKSARSVVLSKSESWHQLALSNSHHPSPRPSQAGLPPTSSHLPKLLPKSKSPSFFRMKKQYEASLSSDNVKKMEDKIRRYFDHSNDNVDAKDSKGKRFPSHDIVTKGLVGLSRSRTMPGICNEKLHLLIPATPQLPATNLNSTDVEKVFDDIFEEATRTDDHRF
ncbi:uncharacterized protein LOC116851692 isoform X2 [Odontomachus brunneus]|nr:uncharacterized protein LOC116851692 isoform X2 [Odontomachus brunneus]